MRVQRSIVACALAAAVCCAATQGDIDLNNEEPRELQVDLWENQLDGLARNLQENETTVDPTVVPTLAPPTTQTATSSPTPTPTPSQTPKATTPKPTETETPKPTEADTPKPTETDTPKPKATETPQPTTTTPTTDPPTTAPSSKTTSKPTQTLVETETEKPTKVPQAANAVDVNPDSHKKSSGSQSKLPSSKKSDSSTTSSNSSLGSGAIAAIIGGAILGVAVIGFAVSTLIRRRRGEDDDPLSPLDLMEKGNVVGDYGNRNRGYNNNTANNGGNGVARTYTMDSQDNSNPNTYEAAGINYNDIYGSVTSPGSLDAFQSTMPGSLTFNPMIEPRRGGSMQDSQMSTSSTLDQNNTNLYASAVSTASSSRSGGAETSFARRMNNESKASRGSYDTEFFALGNDNSSMLSSTVGSPQAQYPEYDESRAPGRGSYEL